MTQCKQTHYTLPIIPDDWTALCVFVSAWVWPSDMFVQELILQSRVTE